MSNNQAAGDLEIAITLLREAYEVFADDEPEGGPQGPQQLWQSAVEALLDRHPDPVIEAILKTEAIHLGSDAAWQVFLFDNQEGFEACGLTGEGAYAAAMTDGGLVIGGGAAPRYRVRLRLSDDDARRKADAVAFWATPGPQLITAAEVQSIARSQQALSDASNQAPSQLPDGGDL